MHHSHAYSLRERHTCAVYREAHAMYTFKALVAVATLSLAAMACGPDRPKGEGLVEDEQQAFATVLDSLRLAHHIPGLSVAVLQDRKIILSGGFGYAKLEDSVPASEHTLYRIASITKPISATVALRLQEVAVLDLDEPMSATPEFDAFCESFKRHSGSIFAEHYACDTEPLTIRDHLRHTVAGTSPKRFRYNPVAYSWTSRPMAHHAAAPFSTLLRNHVFVPAGMRSSARIHRALPLPVDLEARLAKPYRVDSMGRFVPSPDLAPQGDGAAGGTVSSVLDLAAFDKALDEGVLLSKQSLDEMFTPETTADGHVLPYALGWYTQQYEEMSLRWHTGWWEEAYSGLYLKILEKRLSLILLANSEGLWWGMPLEGGPVQESPFAAAFLRAFAQPAGEAP